jgi:hypothetical protein
MTGSFELIAEKMQRAGLFRLIAEGDKAVCG